VAYTYLGGQELTYPGYRDLATGAMLTAAPSVPPKAYDMSPVDTGLPVPPSDGRWAEVQPPAPAPAPAPEPAPAPVPEGGA
jgi:hypothetical protein